MPCVRAERYLYVRGLELSHYSLWLTDYPYAYRRRKGGLWPTGVDDHPGLATCGNVTASMGGTATYRRLLVRGLVSSARAEVTPSGGDGCCGSRSCNRALESRIACRLVPSAGAAVTLGDDGLGSCCTSCDTMLPELADPRWLATCTLPDRAT